MSLQVVYIFSKIGYILNRIWCIQTKCEKTKLIDNCWSQAPSFSNYSISLFFMDFSLFPFGVRYIPLGCRRLYLVPLSFISRAQTIIANNRPSILRFPRGFSRPLSSSITRFERWKEGSYRNHTKRRVIESIFNREPVLYLKSLGRNKWK